MSFDSEITLSRRRLIKLGAVMVGGLLVSACTKQAQSSEVPVIITSKTLPPLDPKCNVSNLNQELSDLSEFRQTYKPRTISLMPGDSMFSVIGQVRQTLSQALHEGAVQIQQLRSDQRRPALARFYGLIANQEDKTARSLSPKGQELRDELNYLQVCHLEKQQSLQ